MPAARASLFCWRGCRILGCLYPRGLDEQLVRRFKLLCSLRGESLKEAVSRLIAAQLDQADLRQELRRFMEGGLS